MAEAADHIALTGRTWLKSTIPFLMRVGASVGGTWITRDVASLVMQSQGRRVRELPTAMPVARCTASAMAFWRWAGSEGRAETGSRLIKKGV